MLATQAPPRITTDEFAAIAALPENADRKLELFHGAIIEHIPTKKHAQLAFYIANLLGQYLLSNPIGTGFIELRVKLTDLPDESVIPDVAFVAKEKLTDSDPESDDDSPLPFMPDLIIEIQSPDQSIRHLREKAEFYLKHGARMVWIVYPKKAAIAWMTADAEDILVRDEVVSGGDVLPGFSLTVNTLLTVP